MSGKSVLVVTDGADKLKKIANDIIGALKGYKVLIKDASSFEGTDLLPAEAFFFGCEKPLPSSFDYIEDLLQHINLAGRPLGVFSSNSEKAVEYLIQIAVDSDVALYPEPFFTENSGDLQKWTSKVLAGKVRQTSNF